jgi:hypothetical protein
MDPTIHGFLASPACLDLEALAAWLDALPDRRRIAEVRSLARAEQALLFDACRGFRPIGLGDFVPADAAPLDEVIHHGRNSLPAFRLFEKRFCRQTRGDALVGYNEQAFRAFTGPGYFVARDAGEGEVLIDYTELPAERPPAWPEILPSSARLGRFVYHGTRDLMRGVSRHVTIGRASRGGQPMDNWFALCRAERRA